MRQTANMRQGEKGWMMVMERAIAGMYWSFLIIAAVQDYRRKQIDLWVFVAFGLLLAGAKGYLWFVSEEKFSWADTAAGIGTGAVLLGLSAVSRGGVGMGDGGFFCVSGLALGFRRNFTLFGISILMCGVWSLFLLTKTRISGQIYYGGLRNKTVPFIPFVLAASVCLEIGGNL